MSGTFGALADATSRARRPGGTVALEVSDLSALMDEMKTKGVSFKSDVIRGPRCRMAVCVDPEGNSVLLHQLDASASS